MRNVTNTTMKKITLTILALLILALGGCGNAYKANSSENNNVSNSNSSNIQQTININPAKPLIEVTRNIDDSITISKLTVLEDQNRTMDLQLSPPSNDPDTITEQFIEAYQKNTDFIKKLLPDDPDNSDIQESTDQERAELDSLSQEPKTPETIMISSLTVTGPDDKVDELKRRLEE